MEPAQSKAFESESEGAATATEEELFCDYLNARLQQALDVLNSARQALLAQPQDYHLAMDVMRKVYDLRDLKKQLEHQRDRVNAARAAAGLAPIGAESVAAHMPTEGFRAAQAEQAEKIMAALKAQPRTCPSCQAMLARHTTRCGCGYELTADVAEIVEGAKTPSSSALSS